MTESNKDYYKHAILAVVALGAVGLGALFFLSGGFSQFGNAASPNAPAAAGHNSGANAAPAFYLKTLDGKSITPSDLEQDKRPTLLYFGATWCPHCSADLSRVASIYPNYKDRVRFVWVDLDQTEPASTIESFKDRFGASSIEFAQTDQKTLINYQIQYTTTRFIVSPTGAVSSAGSGELSPTEWDALFRQVSNL